MNKIILSRYGIDPPIEIQEGFFATLVVEPKHIFYKYVSELKNQIEGCTEQNFHLILNNNTLPMDKHAFGIFDFFNLNLNSKTITNLLLKKLVDFIIRTNQEERITNIEKNIYEIIDDFSLSSGLNIEYSESINATALAKLCGLKISDSSLSLLEKAFNYIDLYCELLPTKILILVFGKEFFTLDEMYQLYEHCYDKQLRLLIIENSDSYPLLQNENRLIIDQDQCIITQNSALSHNIII
ncbi:type II-A CRISPR-associated protein Csn2 [Succinimonas sp.]|uniref:type II-A CRISPR-associated protein Csn2 n=1 Tax=Succinimonas sp. TaxID=1936151 RepID=UPI00386ECC02